MKKRITKKILKKNALFRLWSESWLEHYHKFFDYSFREDSELNEICMSLCKKFQKYDLEQIKKYLLKYHIGERTLKRYLVYFYNYFEIVAG